jgi:hypothetical protein
MSDAIERPATGERCEAIVSCLGRETEDKAVAGRTNAQEALRRRSCRRTSASFRGPQVGWRRRAAGSAG